jgi:hypothetical protein
MDGKVVPEKEIFRGRSWSWSEGRCQQRAQKHAYDHGPFGVNFHEVSISFLNSQYLHFLLQIRMLLRLIPERGGDGTVYGIIVMNDTGSDILTLFTIDLPRLGNIQGYTGWHAPMSVIDANGNLTVFPTILVQVQPVRDDNTP